MGLLSKLHNRHSRDNAADDQASHPTNNAAGNAASNTTSNTGSTGHMTWPPRITRTQIIGEVKDVSGLKFPRDIGRSIWLGGNTYYAFGDTFSHNHKGHFVGVTNTTVAHVPDPINHPTRSEYLNRKERIEEFIPFTTSEYEYENAAMHKQNNDRVVLWSFGGIIEDYEGAGTGWIFHDKLLTHGANPGHYFGMGVARVSVQPDKRLKVDRVMGDNMIFGENEPHFGSISHHIDPDGYVYLLGHHDPDASKLDLRTHLARIHHSADFTSRSAYEFLVDSADGPQWSPTFTLDTLHRLGDLNVQAQGVLFRDENFGPQGRPYLWMGVSKFHANHLFIGAAPAVTGPWEVVDVAPIPDDPDPWDGKSSGPKYALFPNPRASDLRNGVVLCTWTVAAQMGGKVIAARFSFEGGWSRR